MLIQAVTDQFGDRLYVISCPVCHGGGFISDCECHKCFGTGKLAVPKEQLAQYGYKVKMTLLEHARNKERNQYGHPPKV